MHNTLLYANIHKHILIGQLLKIQDNFRGRKVSMLIAQFHVNKNILITYNFLIALTLRLDVLDACIVTSSNPKE